MRQVTEDNQIYLHKTGVGRRGYTPATPLRKAGLGLKSTYRSLCLPTLAYEYT